MAIIYYLHNERRGKAMEEAVKEEGKTKDTWMRGIYILVFAFAYSVAEIVLWAVVLMQFLVLLFTSEKNEKLLVLGKDMSYYIYQILQYVTFNSDEKPFPFSDWPGIDRKYLNDD